MIWMDAYSTVRTALLGLHFYTLVMSHLLDDGPELYTCCTRAEVASCPTAQVVNTLDLTATAQVIYRSSSCKGHTLITI